MFLVYAVVTRACADRRVALAILTGMAAGLIMEAGMTIWQRFGSGVLQTTGSFSHQNLLGMMSLLVTFPFVALLLAGRGGWLPAVVMLASCTVQLLTVSRGTIGLTAFGFAVICVLSALRQWTSRKALVMVVGVAAIIVLAPFALLSIQQRGEVAIEDSNASRVLLNTEAATILSDYPFGVGANQYVAVAHQGYRQPGAEWAAPVHNVYLLVAAETGYFGLITFVVLLLCPLFVAFRCSWRNPRDLRGDLLLGIGVSLLTLYIQCFFEWIFLDYEPQYMFALEVGLVAGLAQQLGYWRRPYPMGAWLGVRVAPIGPIRSKLGR